MVFEEISAKLGEGSGYHTCFWTQLPRDRIMALVFFTKILMLPIEMTAMHCLG